MPIRRQVSEVFAAFVDPSTTITQFWLQGGALSKDATVQWQFMVPGAVATVADHELEVERHIRSSWSNGIRVSIDFTEFGLERPSLL